MNTTHRVIIDCDPGHDDAVALMLAFGSPNEIEILGITTAAGNVPAKSTQKNALMLCEFAGRAHIPVYAGCDRPLLRPAQHAEVHGQTGIDGFAGFEPATSAPARHAVDYIVDTLMAAPDAGITMACIAPMTNLAVALIKEPRIAPKIRQIVLMGGARSAGGNVTPAATFNIHFDPHAAAVVFGCGRPVVAVSLDACSQVLCGKARLAALKATGGRVAIAMADLIAHYDAVRIQKFGFTTDGAPTNDPCVIAYLIDPNLFTARDVNIQIELQSELTLGMTVVDFWGITQRPRNATWVHDADAEGVFALLVERLSRL
ncbi:MAG: nucleoside hydrolase [Casimicrobiaceae bacterium]